MRPCAVAFVDPDDLNGKKLGDHYQMPPCDSQVHCCVAVTPLSTRLFVLLYASAAFFLSISFAACIFSLSVSPNK